MAFYMDDEHFALVKETAAHNLAAWQASGVVKTLKYYSAEDADVCAACAERHGSIVQVVEGKIGDNLPPLGTCQNVRCRCYRPETISIE